MLRVLLTVLLLACSAAASEAVVRYPIARDPEGAVRLSDLVEVVLAELGSGVSVPDTAIESRLPIPTGPAGLATVAAISALLAQYGVSFELRPTDLTVVLDRDRVARSVVGLERWARSVGGVETPYGLSKVAGAGGPPLVLVHGLDSRPSAFGRTPDELGRRGYAVYSYRYPNDGSVRATARDLAARLRGLHRRTGRGVSVLTTSMGGVITRAALELEPYSRGTVDRFLACSPPFHGSPMARYHVLLEIPETVRDLFSDGAMGLFPFDGLGAASFDLLPGSSLMRAFEGTRRAPGVRYAVFAGKKSIVPDDLLGALRGVLFRALEGASPWGEVGYTLLLELTDAVGTVSLGRGDGAVALDSQQLEGVTDRLVRDYHHLDCFDGDREGPIPWLDEALSRLPPP